MAEPAMTSRVLAALDPEERKCLACLIALSLPAEDLTDGEWNRAVLRQVCQMLGLPLLTARSFEPLMEREQLRQPEEKRLPWAVRVEPFGSQLLMGRARLHGVLRDLMVLVALRCGYDARTRVTMRRVCAALRVQWQPEMPKIESLLASTVHDHMAVERERELRSDRWRRYKIGAAMVGGGALLAVTGGLAAPAIAAGLAASGTLIGASAAATLTAFATTTWMATLFGATGAGLLGYKMDRRTKGISEFRFELETSGHEMSVFICISGLLKDKWDFQRAWGAPVKNLPALETLQRFYAVFNPDRQAEAANILRDYRGRELALCKALSDKYGHDPRRPLTKDVVTAALAARGVVAQASPSSGATDGANQGSAEWGSSVDAAAIESLMEAVLEEEKARMGRYSAAADAAEDASVSDVQAEQRASAGDSEEREISTQSRNSESQQRARADDTEEPEVSIQSRNSESNVAEEDLLQFEAAAGEEAASNGGDLASDVLAASQEGAESEAIVEGGSALDDMSEVSSQVGATAAAGEATSESNLVLVEPPVSEEAASSSNGELLRGWSSSDQENGGGSSSDSGANNAESSAVRVWFWQDEVPSSSQYILCWETALLRELGKSVETMLLSASRSAAQEALKVTAMSALITAVALPLALISLTDIIDTDWTVGCERADAAGKILADALLSREQGCRPVTLVAYSMGARMVFSCLTEMARRERLWQERVAGANLKGSGKDKKKGKLFGSFTRSSSSSSGSSSKRDSLTGSSAGSAIGFDKKHADARPAAGVLENVVLLGAPVGVGSEKWDAARSVVHGRVINAYSSRDWILGLIYRAKSLSLKVAGIQPVDAPGIENIDVSSLVDTHFDYARKIPELLRFVELDDCNRYVPGYTPRSS